jgi:hypothetical protein
LVIGREAVILHYKREALDRIYLDTVARGEQINAIKKLAAQHAVPVNYVPAANSIVLMLRIMMVVCVAFKDQYQDMQDIISLQWRMVKPTFSDP